MAFVSKQITLAEEHMNYAGTTGTYLHTDCDNNLPSMGWRKHKCAFAFDTITHTVT